LHGLKTCPQNSPKATKPVQDPRNCNKNSTPKTRQRQCPTPSLTSRNSWIDQGRKEEKRKGIDLENRETDKENREILDGNGKTNSEILGIMGNSYHERFHPLCIYPQLERQPEDNQATMLVKDYEILWNGRRSERVQDNMGKLIEREHCNTDEKGINQMVLPDVHDKESIREMEKDTRCECVDQGIADMHFKMHDSNENNHYTYSAIPFGTKHSPIYFATAMEPIMQEIRMKSEIRIINYVDNILLLHQNKEYLKNMTQKVIETLIYFGFTTNIKREGQPKLTVILQGREWNLTNAAGKNETEEAVTFQHDLYNRRRQIKTGMEITKAQAARMRGWNKTITMNKTAILYKNWGITKHRGNIPAQLIQTPPQTTVTTDAAPNAWGSILEKELKMITMAQRTWNKSQANLTSNIREIKAITQGQRNFAKVLENSHIQSIAIRSDNSAAVFDIKKWRASISLIKEIKQVHQTTERLGIQIYISHLL
ncbi:MAG: hypothetical protein EZS28_035548, partial [Streblomastix strix]